MPSPLAAHPPWRRLLVLTVAVPALAIVAVLVFAWPAARIAPRDLPVGVVGSSAQQITGALDAAHPGAFDVHLYVDRAAAEHAIRDRDVYGAFVSNGTSDGNGLTVLEASAASTTVAQLLTTAGTQLGTHSHQRVRTVDVVPTSTDDPRGLVLSTSLLPLTICSLLVGAGIALVGRFRPAWHAVAGLGVVSIGVALGVYLVAEVFLGALPHQPWETLGALALTTLSIGAVGGGLAATLGSPTLGVAGVLMVFIGNPFSAATSAPELLPGAVRVIGQLLPPGAGANLVRSTAYFDGRGAAVHIAVLAVWTALGLTAVVLGHHKGAAAHRNEQPAAPRHLDLVAVGGGRTGAHEAV